jgi:hypothetical protein
MLLEVGGTSNSHSQILDEDLDHVEVVVKS